MQYADLPSPGEKILDYYATVVIDYLRADRAIFVNSEFCIQPTEKENPDESGPHWYCDVVALDFGKKTVYLCEITFAADLGKLTAIRDSSVRHFTSRGTASRDTVGSSIHQRWGTRGRNA